MIVKCPVCENEIATNAPGRLTRDLEAKLTIIRQEERRAAFKDAVEIIDRLVCDPNYDSNWRNGYGQAQSDMEDALEAAANETKEDGDDG